MNTWVRKSFKVGVLSAGVLLLGGNAANAGGTSAGNQVYAQVQAPINICDNALGAEGGCYGGSWAALGGAEIGNWASYGSPGIGTGNQIQAPVGACDNAVGVFGNTHAYCQGGASAHGHRGKHHHKRHHESEHIYVVTHGGEDQDEQGTDSNDYGSPGVGSGDQCDSAPGLVGNVPVYCPGDSTVSTEGGYGGGTPGVTGGYGYTAPGHTLNEGTTVNGYHQ